MPLSAERSGKEMHEKSADEGCLVVEDHPVENCSAGSGSGA